MYYMRIVKAPKCKIGIIPKRRESRIWDTKIISNKDVPILNRYGSIAVRPNGSRQPNAEINIIAKIMMAVNNMSVFSST